MKTKATVRNMRLDDIDHVYEIETSSLRLLGRRIRFIMS